MASFGSLVPLNGLQTRGKPIVTILQPALCFLYRARTMEAELLKVNSERIQGDPTN
jgi:hypothetical protein